jgi:hypothetical protein
MQMLRKEKAPATLIPIMIGGSVGGREAAAVALANLAAGSKDTAVTHALSVVTCLLTSHLFLTKQLLICFSRCLYPCLVHKSSRLVVDSTTVCGRVSLKLTTAHCYPSTTKCSADRDLSDSAEEAATSIV